MLWLKTYRPDLAVEDPAVQKRMAQGNAVGDLAMALFGDFEEMTATKEDGSLDLSQMIKNTAEAVKRGVENICEAAFSFHGLYCAVDILHKEKGGYAIYEVKSSTEPKPVYFTDISYQKYVLEQCGVNVTGTYVVNIDNSYVFDGTLDIQKLFKITDVSEKIQQENETRDVEAVLATAKRVLSTRREPALDLSEGCKSPYPCVFWNYCARRIPAPSVFNLYRMPFTKQLELYRDGATNLNDVKAQAKLTDLQLQQIDFILEDKPEHVDKDGLKAFLNQLSYPLYFLDFETAQFAVPEFIQSKPYQQIPFQYSLHYLESEDGELNHKAFLDLSGNDPRRALAERLCNDIPENACVLSFNATFEKNQLKDLALLFPDLAKKLTTIRENVYDLLVPFRKGYYYNKAIGASFSIKSILPAMFPDDPELDYHGLDGVQNGGDAMEIFQLVKDMPPEKREIAKNNLLAYCKLDTFAMVKIWQKLKELCK
ncbi:MAG: DUF2779 domain-containing protein [Clostridia bacterium]|nr:DUF2779 domain-containing protein [Clostridia bacterium]